MSKNSITLVDLDHGGEHLGKLTRGGTFDIFLNIRIFIDNVTIFIEDSKTFKLFTMCPKLEICVEFVAEHHIGVKLVHGAEGSFYLRDQ